MFASSIHSATSSQSPPSSSCLTLISHQPLGHRSQPSLPRLCSVAVLLCMVIEVTSRVSVLTGPVRHGIRRSFVTIYLDLFSWCQQLRKSSPSSAVDDDVEGSLSPGSRGPQFLAVRLLFSFIQHSPIRTGQHTRPIRARRRRICSRGPIMFQASAGERAFHAGKFGSNKFGEA